MSYYQFCDPDDPTREPWGSCEVFYVDRRAAFQSRLASWKLLGKAFSDIDNSQLQGTPYVGWYWHPCVPGCLSDGAPVGPFATEAEACADAGVAL